MLEVSGLKACYGKVEVLQDVSLSVTKGEIVGLLGRNGVGKTTTLKAILGLVRKTGGSVAFDGEEITGLPPHKIPGHGIGYVPQGRGIFPNLTVEENLFIGLPRSPDREIRDYVFERFPRLAERLGQNGGTLSGGEQQQLAIARCLAMRPKLILLDEPTEGIMPILVQEIRREILEINATGVSILLVEQNLSTAFKICNRVYLMEKGVVVRESTTEELKRQPKLVHRYLGMAA
ncbi:MAG: ABC transporter ATP-binding protein [Hyphomicrobiales bacterium]|nr:ABC transporter ATP-binding protein [Hyphomicrobiales bacterium]